MAPRVRIAPSPTGDPHVGTAYVALFNRAFADAQDGTFVLRIDDTDRTRYQSDSERAIFAALRWLGLQWDEGPEVGGAHDPYHQSKRTALYQEVVDKLLENGMAYRCFCTPERLQRLREKQRAEKLPYGYDRKCRNLSEEEIAAHLEAGDPFTVRLKVPLDGTTTFEDQLRGTITINNAEVDDQILMKSDGYPTYHLANVVDDSRMGITHVVRAEEWIISTPKHILIYEALGEPLPLFFHVPLLRNADQSKISKRKNPVSLDWYRQEGYLPEALLNFLALLGWSPPDGEEVFSFEKFRENFRLEDISTGGPVFDMEKLNWLNGVHLRALEPEQLRERLQAEGFLDSSVSAEEVAKILPVVSERMHRLTDFAPQTAFYFGDVDPDPAGLIPKKKEAADGVALLESAAQRLGQNESWTLESVEADVEAVREELGLKKPQMFMPLRMALTGRKDAPGVFELLEVLGRERSVARIEQAARKLAEQGGGA